MSTRINPATGRPYGVSAKEWTAMLEAHVRRLSGCLLVIGSAHRAMAGELRYAAIVAAQGASVETVRRDLGLTMPIGSAATEQPTAAQEGVEG